MKFFLQYRLHIALLAALLTLAPFPRITARSTLIALALGLLVAWVYLFNKTTDATEDDVNDAARPLSLRQQKRIRKVAVACLLLPMLWLWRWPDVFAVYVFFGAVMGFLYSYPLRFGRRKVRLKDILLVKNIVPAFSMAACTNLPFFILYPVEPSVYLWAQAISVFIVMFCVEVVWDIRDMAGDRKAGVQTLPNRIGLDGAKAVAATAFAGYCVWVDSLFSLRLLGPLLVAQAVTLLVILLARPNRPYWYFHLPILVWLGLYIALTAGKL